MPDHLRDAHYAGARDEGFGDGYVYPHDDPGAGSDQQYLPDGTRRIAATSSPRTTARARRSSSDWRARTRRADPTGRRGAGRVTAVEAAQLRSIFLDYFAANGHTDRAVGEPHPPRSRRCCSPSRAWCPSSRISWARSCRRSTRAVSIQKCFRAPDIDIIGTTQRHLTFFEMMGNFSFGDYFKEGAIRYAWGLITEGFGLDPERLWVTVHTSDDQAEELWRDMIGVRRERIQRLDEDNFWDMGETGPCGPCSEIFFDKGPAFGDDGRTGLRG